MRADGASVEIVGTEEPVAVPAVLFHGLDHGIDMLHGAVGLGVKAEVAAQLGVVAAIDHELACNHKRLGLAAFGLVLSGLERFVGVVGEAVEVEAVVPVGAADEGQSVGAEVAHHVVEAHAQVFHEAHFGAGLIVEGHGFVEDGEVAAFLDIGDGAENQPHGVVVEATADVVVASLGERLILVVATAVGKLRGGYIDDALAGTLGNLMNEAHEVLVGVAEAHAAADAALEERRRTREAEGNHALVLIPDVDHAVEALVAAAHGEAVEQIVPVAAKRAIISRARFLFITPLLSHFSSCGFST